MKKTERHCIGCDALIGVVKNLRDQMYMELQPLGLLSNFPNMNECGPLELWEVAIRKIKEDSGEDCKR